MPEGKCDGSFTKDRKIYGRAMCGVQLKDRKISTDVHVGFV